MAAVRRYDQGTAVLGRRVIDVRSRFEQHSGGVHIALLRSKKQRRKAARRMSMDIRSVIDQQPLDLGMFLRYSPHESGLPARALLCIGVRPMRQQRFHYI